MQNYQTSYVFVWFSQYSECLLLFSYCIYMFIYIMQLN